MTILLNGEPHTLADGTTIAALLAELGHGERRVAVEVNREIVPRGRHATHVLDDGDTVELVHAMGGG
ncbi:sulfur carrier protein ThiS [Chiayiivirga flava]|uniref:Sulfur carrier protein n=1 Tax=Chiayiivirga flava TaxID=659595 RepID=A0A7W8G1J4_9GAMM|nr:sulfur carrier protein ThiS [Chiayiivirga flava]MBB5208928.1 sulfur carrier protein [Chiayiivirga flava]